MGLVIQPTCLSRVILENIAQDCVQVFLEHLLWGKVCSLSGQSVPGLGYLHSKEVPSCSDGSSCAPVSASCPIAWHHREEPGPILFSHPLFRQLCPRMRCPLTHLSRPSSLSLLSRQMLQPFSYLCCSPLNPLQDLHVSLVLRTSEANTALQMWPHQGSVNTKDKNLWPDFSYIYIYV